jgi:hypothetical protein
LICQFFKCVNIFKKNSKYKKIVDFKLKTFVEDYSKQQSNLKKSSTNLSNIELETSSETFRAIQKEDWIAPVTKDGLKTLKDYLNFLIKSIKTIKSNVFYDKICNYLRLLFKYVFL